MKKRSAELSRKMGNGKAYGRFRVILCVYSLIRTSLTMHRYVFDEVVGGIPRFGLGFIQKYSAEYLHLVWRAI